MASAEAGGILASTADLPREIQALHGPLSLFFVLGVILFLASLGASRWIYSRLLGLLSTTVAVAAIGIAALLFRPFVHVG